MLELTRDCTCSKRKKRTNDGKWVSINEEKKYCCKSGIICSCSNLVSPVRLSSLLLIYEIISLATLSKGMLFVLLSLSLLLICISAVAVSSSLYSYAKIKISLRSTASIEWYFNVRFLRSSSPIQVRLLIEFKKMANQQHR